MNLAPGDVAVYPGRGVIDVCNCIQMSGQSMFEIEFWSGGKGYLPTNKVDEVGVRSVTLKTELLDTWQTLRGEPHYSSETWNRRSRSYHEKIRRGQLDELASIVRDLVALQQRKALSYGESRMLSTAMDLLSQELSITLKCKAARIERVVKRIIVQCYSRRERVAISALKKSKCNVTVRSAAHRLRSAS